MPSETIAIAADHAGFALKQVLRDKLEELGFEVLDLGTDSASSVDYPDFGHALAREPFAPAISPSTINFTAFPSFFQNNFVDRS